MMLGYAARRGLRRHLVPVPVLTPRLSSHWVRWMTPVPGAIARPLVEGLRNEVIVRDDSGPPPLPRHPSPLLRGGARPGARAARARRGRDRLERRALELPARRPHRDPHHRGGDDHRAAHRAGGPRPRAALPCLHRARRRARLALHELGLGDPGCPRPAGGGAGLPARAARPRQPPAGRRPRLLAGGGRRAGTAAPAPGRDEGPGPRLAPVRGPAPATAAPCSARPPTSRRTDWPATSTGTRSTPSTPPSSGTWSGAWPSGRDPWPGSRSPGAHRESRPRRTDPRGQ